MSTRRFTRAALVPLVVLLVACGAAPAGAQAVDTIDEVAQALGQDPVYVSPQVAAPTPDQESAIEAAIRDAAPDTGSIFVAVLPEDAADGVGGDPDVLLSRLGEAVSVRGTYFLVVGDDIRAGSTESTGRVGEIAREAADANQGNVTGALLDAVATLRTEGVDGGGSGVGGLVVLGVLLLALIGGAFLFLRSRRRRREQERAQADEVRTTILEDLVSLDAANRDLDNDLRLAQPSREIQQYALAGVESYAQASRAVDEARRPQDFEPASHAVEEGLYSVAAARALLEGREVPERRPPCFFDPRHGPSVTDAVWAPPGGQSREVPVCAADAARIADGEEPVGRQVTVDGERRSYWDAPAYYGPWAGGWYGANSGFLSGMLIGSWFGGPGWGWGGGYGGYGGGDSGGGDGGDGGGDFGGGDFGGGDFGGGDFGGGDFGGGDFGGGDF